MTSQVKCYLLLASEIQQILVIQKLQINFEAQKYDIVC